MKRKKSVTEIVQQRIQSGTEQNGKIMHQYRIVDPCPQKSQLRDLQAAPVGKEVTDHRYNEEFPNTDCHIRVGTEGEFFIEEVTAGSAYAVTKQRGDPVAKPCQVQQQIDNGHANECIDTAHQQEPH
ncbi:MAG: hypothetical protein JWN30_2591 [Bacilli bacterium]|nr:hypothetical protein [Bacilli bacterium]